MAQFYRQTIDLSTIDMTPAGEILPRPMRLSWSARIGLAATVIAVCAGIAAAAAILLWVASVLLPLALVAGLIAFGAFKWQVWQRQRRAY